MIVIEPITPKVLSVVIAGREITRVLLNPQEFSFRAFLKGDSLFVVETDAEMLKQGIRGRIGTTEIVVSTDYPRGVAILETTVGRTFVDVEEAVKCEARSREDAEVLLGEAGVSIDDGLMEAVHRIIKERDEARDWVKKLTATERTLTCVYCGHAYPPGSPTHGADVLTAHVKVCEKHPMRAAEARLARKDELLVWVADVLREDDGENPSLLMKAVQAELAGNSWTDGSKGAPDKGQTIHPADALALKLSWLYKHENAMMCAFELACAKIGISRLDGLAMALDRTQDHDVKPEIDPTGVVVAPDWETINLWCWEIMVHATYLFSMAHMPLLTLRSGILSAIYRLHIGDDPRHPW